MSTDNGNLQTAYKTKATCQKCDNTSSDNVEFYKCANCSNVTCYGCLISVACCDEYVCNSCMVEEGCSIGGYWCGTLCDSTECSYLSGCCSRRFCKEEHWSRSCQMCSIRLCPSSNTNCESNFCGTCSTGFCKDHADNHLCVFDCSVCGREHELYRNRDFVAYKIREYPYGGTAEEVKDCIDYYTKIINEEPDNAYAYLERGYRYYYNETGCEDLARARKDCDKAIQIFPDDDVTYEFILTYLDGLYDWQEIIDYYIKLSELRPKDRDLYLAIIELTAYKSGDEQLCKVWIDKYCDVFGVPSGGDPSDWIYESGYILSEYPKNIIL